MRISAVDMGGASIRPGIVDNGNLPGAKQIIAKAHSSLEKILASSGDGLKNLPNLHSSDAVAMDGTGISLPAIVDSDRQRLEIILQIPA